MSIRHICKLSPRPMHAPRERCGCGALVDPLRAHPSRTSFSALKSAPSSPVQGLRATSLEPNCSKVAGSNPATSAGDRAHILCVVQDRPLSSDVFVIHCCADTYVDTAAATAGSAAEGRAAKKVAKYALCKPGGYDFTPHVVESYGRQCSPRIHS